MNSPAADLYLSSSHGPNLQLGRDKLEVVYVGEGRHQNDVGAIQASRPILLDQDVFYFEVTVLDAGDSGRIGVGLTQRDFKLSRQPGCAPSRPWLRHAAANCMWRAAPPSAAHHACSACCNTSCPRRAPSPSPPLFT